jgi:hypothetical protein
MTIEVAPAECSLRRSAAMSGRRDRHIQDTGPGLLVIRGPENGLETGADAGSQTDRASASATEVEGAELPRFPEDFAHPPFSNPRRRG